MTDYRFQRLTKENISSLVPLYKRAFGMTVSSVFLQKKYDTGKFGASHLGYIAFFKDKPVAYYGVIPSQIHVDGQRMLAAQSADTMTDPDHRRRGLFVTLAEKTYALSREAGIEFIYGFPNEASYPGFLKLNWKFLPESLQLFRISAPGSLTTLLNLAGLGKKPDQLLNPLEVNPLQLFQNDGDSSGVHDQNFIDYKKYNSTHFINMDGSLVWLKVGKDMKVGFAVPAADQGANHFIQKTKTLAARLGCRNVFFITNRSSALYHFLHPTLPAVEAFKVGFYPLTGRNLDLSGLRFEYCDIDSF